MADEKNEAEKPAVGSADPVGPAEPTTAEVVRQPPVKPQSVEPVVAATPAATAVAPPVVAASTIPVSAPANPEKKSEMTPEKVPEKKSRKVLNTRLVLKVILVVLIVAIVTILFLAHRKSSKQAAVQKSAQAHTQSLAQADKLEYKSDFNGEVQALQKYLATKPSQQDANEATMKLATAYINTGNYNQAIVYYKQVQASGDSRYTIATLNGLAVAYTMKKDKATAIKYYQQVIATYKSQNNQYDTAPYEKIIQSLQSQP
jgi:hypothetical protein